MKKAAGRDILSLEATNGKISIHLGLYTVDVWNQGKRWIEYKTDKIKDELFNNFWVWPTLEETPQNASKVEGGCYW